MRAFRVFLLSLAAGVIFAGCSGERAAVKQGRADAQEDIAKGVLCIAYAQGTEFPACFAEYDELLASKYKIRWHLYAPPLKPQQAQARARGYNEVSQVEIEHRFGTNVLAKTLAEAEKLHAAGSRNGRTPRAENDGK